MVKRFPKGHQIVIRGMLNLSRMVKHPMDLIPWDSDTFQYALFTPQDRVKSFLQELQELGYVRSESGAQGFSGISIRPNGWEHIQEWERQGASKPSKQAFVAMWSDDSMHAYEKAIKDGIKDAKYECMIIKDKEHNNDICDEIIAEIRKSRFIVADFTAGCCENCDTCEKQQTCQDKVRPRGGVYFEAGFAMGLGIPVIWVVRDDQLPQIHFDTRNYKYVTYKTPEELQTRLRQRIEATIV